ncbi:hypothetical protein EV426DRAFT_700054 [Tirmania nivea]|nr:hypothetical protein EV426DRAFT_700054 [Tirmania nivea]
MGVFDLFDELDPVHRPGNVEIIVFFWTFMAVGGLVSLPPTLLTAHRRAPELNWSITKFVIGIWGKGPELQSHWNAWSQFRMRSPKQRIVVSGGVGNAEVSVLARIVNSPSIVADGKGREWEQIWEDPEWCQKLAGAVRG